MCEDHVELDDATMECYRFGPAVPPPPAPEPPQPDPFHLRLLKYGQVALKHRMSGLASYYSTSLDGTLTSTGEIFRNRKLTAAHLTLPLGTWVELTARATGRTIRVRINDRGPFVKKFAIDLSQAAARALGVDIAEDRHVEMRIIALPGEDPLPQPMPEAVATASTLR
ncbi:MAG TPA: septal ring lytic transglycosylase RlpA family protein [Thermoanaerobaculia bacterium]|nr:septal ring lytic transglycosylase RlpA family protein [Thermoanaerobaculia bacterium]